MEIGLFCDIMHRLIWIIALLCIEAGCVGRSTDYSPPPTPPPIVVFAGDSLTQQMQWYWSETLPSMYVNFIDAGVGGNTSAALLARYKKDVLSSPARVVHLLIGTNDSFDDVQYNSIPLAVTEGNIAKMAFACRTRFRPRRVIIGTVPPIVRQYPQSELINNHIRELNAWIKLFAAQYKFAVADYYSALEQDDFLNPAYCIDGRVHLNRAGYEAIAPITLQALAETE